MLLCEVLNYLIFLFEWIYVVFAEFDTYQSDHGNDPKEQGSNEAKNVSNKNKDMYVYK